MCSSNPNDFAFSCLDKSWYDEKLCTVWQMYFLFSPNVNLTSFQSLTNFFLWHLVTVMDFCLIDLSRLYITQLNTTSPIWAFSFIDSCLISRLSLPFSWCFCCNSVFKVIVAIFCWIFLLPDFIANFTFANVGRRSSFLHVLIKLISLMILNHLRLIFSIDFTFYNTKWHTCDKYSWIKVPYKYLNVITTYAERNNS